MIEKAKSFWFEEKNKANIRVEEIRNIPDNHSIIKTHYSSISPGTEKLIYDGKVPLSMHKQMACPYMEGNFFFPIKYGYSLVGEVITGSHVGKIVHVLHPHQTICCVHEDAVSIVPKEIPKKRATLASNLETAVNAIWDANISIGDKVLVVGFGIIGSLVAHIANSIAGVSVDVVDTNLKKEKLAQKMGFSTISKPEKYSYDISFHCSASSGGLQLAIDSVGVESKVVELSWYGMQNVSISLGESFHCMRKQIISSQVSLIPQKKQSRWNYKRRKDLVFSLLKSEKFDEHITHSFAFEELPDIFPKINKINGLSYVIDYSTR